MNVALFIITQFIGYFLSSIVEVIASVAAISGPAIGESYGPYAHR